jgi:eukaryotic-like serine/threonine-protein kinase
MSNDSGRTTGGPPPHDGGLVKGATIGRYVVLALIGRGGMGEVYAAYDPELDRKIAIKLLKTRDAAAADGAARLLREAQAIARLSHPNVVVVYDVGTFGASVFIAMEFVEGNTIAYWLQAANRTWRAVLEVYLAAGRGLNAAHAAGLVHRDFKPENVMITKSGEVRVMDFGLAREQGQEAPEPDPQQTLAAAELAAAMAATVDTGDPDATAKLGADRTPAAMSSSGKYLNLKLTQTGAMLGTPAYMAPEQFRGAGGDARADQFSFCVALYEGLYRRRPFAGNRASELMANVMAGAITQVPEDAHVPGWIRRVLLRGLRVAPADRHESMAVLLAELGRDPALRRRRWLAATTGLLLLAGVALAAHRLSAGERALCEGGPARAAATWGARQRTAIARAFEASGNKRAAQAFAAAAGLFDRYVVGWTGMYQEACKATHVRGEQSAGVLDLRMGCLGERLSALRAMTEVFAAADDNVVDNAVNAASNLPTLERCADVEMLRAVVRPPDDPSTRAAVARVREDVAKINALAMSGQCDAAAKSGPAVVAQAKALGYRPIEAEALYAIGRLGETCTDTVVAIGELEDAVLAAEASHHDEIAIEGSMYLNLMWLDRAHDLRMGRYWTRHAQALLARLPGHPKLEAWMAQANALLLGAEDRLEDALGEGRRALAIQEATLGTIHVDVGASLVIVAMRLHDLGRDAEAAPLIARAVVVFVKLFGDANGRVAVALLDEAEILTQLGQHARARADLERALAIWKSHGASPTFVGFGLLDMGRLELAEGRVAQARETLERALDLLHASDPPTRAEAEFALAEALWAAPGDRARAGALAEKARATLAATPGARRKVGRIDAWLAAQRI